MWEVPGTMPLLLYTISDNYNIIQKSGSWFSYGDTKLGQGRDSVKQIIGDNPELADELETKIFAAMQGNTEEQE